MKKQIENYNGFERGLFYVLADTVAELNEIAERTGGSIDVITIRAGGSFERFGSLTCAPEDWKGVCQAEIDEDAYASDWDRAEETVCVDDCRKHHLCVTLDGQEWGFEGEKIARYQCPECESWFDSADAAKECCED